MTKAVWIFNAKADTSKVKRVKINKQDALILNAKTLPSNAIMNDVLFPHEEIVRTYKSLIGKPVPLGHPVDFDSGAPLDAQEGVGYTEGYMAAFVHDARLDTDANGRTRVDLDIAVMEKKAMRTPEGKIFMDMVNTQDTIDTSVGVYMDILKVHDKSLPYSGIAKISEFNHNAVMPRGVEPAHSPEEGTGIFVNEINKDEKDKYKPEMSNYEEYEKNVLFVCEDDISGFHEETHEDTKSDNIWNIALKILSQKGEKNMTDSTNKDMEVFNKLDERISNIESRIPDNFEEAIKDAVKEVAEPLLATNAALMESKKAEDEKVRLDAFDKLVKAGYEENEIKDFDKDALVFMASKIEKSSNAKTLSVNETILEDADELAVFGDLKFDEPKAELEDAGVDLSKGGE